MNSFPALSDHRRRRHQQAEIFYRHRASSHVECEGHVFIIIIIWFRETPLHTRLKRKPYTICIPE